MAISFQFFDDLRNVGAELFLTLDDAVNLGVEGNDVHHLAGVLLGDVGGDGEVELVVLHFLQRGQVCDVLDVLALGEDVNDSVDVVFRELVVVGHLHAFVGGIDEESLVVGLVLLEHHDAGGDGGAEEEVSWKLDHAVHEIVGNKVLPDFLFCAAAVHDAGEADDGGGAVGCEPADAVHDERHVRLAFRGEDARGRESGVVDENRVGLAGPFDGVGRVGDNQLEGLVVPVLGGNERVLAGDIELVEGDIVQEHVDAAQVVGGDVDFLAEEAARHLVAPQHFLRFQQEGAGAACGVVHAPHLLLAHRAQAREQHGNLRRREELAAGLAGVGGVHGHQVLIGIAEGVDVMVAHITELHVRHTLQQLAQALVSLGHGGAQLVAVGVEVVEQAFQVGLALRAHGGVFYVVEYPLQRLVQVIVVLGVGQHIAEKLAGQDEKALFLDQVLKEFLGLAVRKGGVVEQQVAGIPLALVHIVAQVFRNVPVEHGTQHIVLEVPSIHRTAQFIGNRPYRAVQFLPFLLRLAVSHCSSR